MELEVLAYLSPKIFVKEYNTSLNTQELAVKVDRILGEFNLSNGFNKVLAEFFQLFPNDDLSLDKLVDLILLSVYCFLLDDCIEESRDNGIHWLKIFDNKESTIDTPLETLYQKNIKVFLAKLPEYQRMRLINSFKETTNCSLIEHDDMDSLARMNLQEYTDFRISNNQSEFQVFALEYGLNLCFTEELYNCSQMQKMFFNFNQYLSIVQDLYSFKKEMGTGYGKVNYLNVVIKQYNCDLKEAIDKSIKILNELEIQLHEELGIIVDTFSELGTNFIKGMGNFLHATHDFYKICGRYN